MSAPRGFTLPPVGTARIVRKGGAGRGMAQLLGQGSAGPPTSAMAAAQSGDVAKFPLPGPGVLGARGAGTDREADRAIAALYAERYRSLVRLAALLVDDMATAEEVVQDSFIAIHANWRRLQDIDKAAGYLRQCVVNRSHSVLRHRGVVNRNVMQPLPAMPSAEEEAMKLLSRSAVITALQGLPPRQRQALVLRYYAGLSEAQIASTMGITQGAVKRYVSRAMSALRAMLAGEA
jgi:RNA polymerase sigma-70 factor (sigma-E family)